MLHERQTNKQTSQPNKLRTEIGPENNLPRRKVGELVKEQSKF